MTKIHIIAYKNHFIDVDNYRQDTITVIYCDGLGNGPGMFFVEHEMSRGKKLTLSQQILLAIQAWNQDKDYTQCQILQRQGTVTIAIGYNYRRAPVVDGKRMTALSMNQRDCEIPDFVRKKILPLFPRSATSEVVEGSLLQYIVRIHIVPMNSRQQSSIPQVSAQA